VITHPEKVLFPDNGITKGELASYYESVAPFMLPHIRGRPITMERYPNEWDRQERVLAEGCFERLP
jgi:bifunctional non-homologous end joining protein LigD